MKEIKFDSSDVTFARMDFPACCQAYILYSFSLERAVGGSVFKAVLSDGLLDKLFYMGRNYMYVAILADYQGALHNVLQAAGFAPANDWNAATGSHLTTYIYTPEDCVAPEHDDEGDF